MDQAAHINTSFASLVRSVLSCERETSLALLCMSSECVKFLVNVLLLFRQVVRLANNAVIYGFEEQRERPANHIHYRIV